MHKRHLLIALLSLTIVLTACSEARNSTGMISKRIGEVVHNPASAELDLAKLTTFGWEYFYAFKPGTAREEVCKFIGANRNTCGRIIRIEKSPDDHMFLLFGKDGNLTHVELHAVANGMFDVSFGDSGIPKSSAVFRVRRSSSGGATDSIVLEPK
jgi:hypothetical protein